LLGDFRRRRTGVEDDGVAVANQPGGGDAHFLRAMQALLHRQVQVLAVAQRQRASSLLARHDSGSAYYLEAGLDGVAAILHQGAAETLALAGVTADAVRYAFFGPPA